MKELLEFQKKITAIKKDGQNPHFKSTYATLPHILGEVKPILSELGLTLTQPIRDNKVLSIISNDKGELEVSELELPSGLNPQQIGSAITYYRRYTLASLLSLEIEDDDANLASLPKSEPKNDDDNRPWLTEQLLKKIIERFKLEPLKKQETKDQAFKTYRMKKEYREKIEKA